MKRKRGREARAHEFSGVIVERAKNSMCRVQWNNTGGPRGEKAGEIGSKWYNVNKLVKSGMPMTQSWFKNPMKLQHRFKTL